MTHCFRRTFGVSLAVGALLVAALSPEPASAQVFNPEDGGDLIDDVVVQIAGGKRVNERDEPVGRIGVTQCSEQIGETINFIYKLNALLNAGTQSRIELEDAYLIEFTAGSGIDGTCNPIDNDTNGCRRLDESQDGISITEGNNVIQADLDFEVMLRWEDQRTEECAFVTSAQTQTSTQPLNHDAGDASMSDVAPRDAVSDTGMGGGMDVAIDAGAPDSAASRDTAVSEPVEGADRYYVVRLHLTSTRLDNIGQRQETEEVVDAPLLIDRTRPNPPSNIDAASTENTLKVAFDPPSNIDEVDSYHAFFANEALDSSLTPEELADQKSVERRTIKGVSDKDGRMTGKVDDIGQKAGDSLYVAIASRDDGRNFSNLARKTDAITIQESVDFWEKYNDAGGGEPGGCACGTTGSNPANLLLAVGVLGGLLLSRHRWKRA